MLSNLEIAGYVCQSENSTATDCLELIAIRQSRKLVNDSIAFERLQNADETTVRADRGRDYIALKQRPNSFVMRFLNVWNSATLR